MMLFAKELGLVGQSHFYKAFAILQYTLAAKAGIDPWAYSSVDKVFLSVSKLRQAFASFFHIKVAGAACAYHSAIVVQINIVFKGNFQNALAGCHVFERDRGQAFLFKIDFNGVHA